MSEPRHWPLVSVVIPARNEAALIERVVESVLAQASRAEKIEIIVVDDGSTDDTAALALACGARVIEMRRPGERGNVAVARNRGAAESRGDPIVFLDADCVPAPQWLDRLLAAHERDATVAGGSLSLPPGLPVIARCDYYCGWYLIHPRARAGWVPHHPPPNLSVRRKAYLSTSGFASHPPFDFSNEERFWQGELRRAGHRFYFEPSAIAAHYNHPGLGNLLRRNYRWGYTAVEVKSQTGAARAAWLYRFPWLILATSPLLVLGHTAFILICWLRAGVYEPIVLLPAVLASRMTYVAGMCMGAIRWLQFKGNSAKAVRQRPRWE